MIEHYINLPLNSIPNSLISEIIMSLFSHILYMREQIPSTIEFLQHHMDSISDEDKKTMKSNRLQKNTIKFLNEYKSIQSSITEFSKKFPVYEVRIVIGPTVSCPREIYTIKFNPNVCNMEDMNMSEDERMKNCRRVIRKIISMWSEDAFKSTPPVTNTFIALRLGHPLSAEIDTTGFYVRQELNFRLRKSSPPPCIIHISTANFQSEVEDGDVENEAITDVAPESPMEVEITSASRVNVTVTDQLRSVRVMRTLSSLSALADFECDGDTLGILPSVMGIRPSADEWLILSKGIKGMKKNM